jgi:hypothetical protein
VANFNTNRAETIASIERVKQIAPNLKATVIVQHDPRDVDKLPCSRPPRSNIPTSPRGCLLPSSASHGSLIAGVEPELCNKIGLHWFRNG